MKKNENYNKKANKDLIKLDDLCPRENVKGGKAKIVFGTIGSPSNLRNEKRTMS